MKRRNFLKAGPLVLVSALLFPRLLHGQEELEYNSEAGSVDHLKQYPLTPEECFKNYSLSIGNVPMGGNVNIHALFGKDLNAVVLEVDGTKVHSKSIKHPGWDYMIFFSSENFPKQDFTLQVVISDNHYNQSVIWIPSREFNLGHKGVYWEYSYNS